MSTPNRPTAAGIMRMLRDPTQLPTETKAWLQQYVQISPIEIPRSSVTGLYTTASNVTELGAPAHGRPVMVRVGATPYEFVQMTYDDVYGKWVATAALQAFQIGGPEQYFLSTLNEWRWADFTFTNFPGFYIPNIKSVYEAGLRPQVSVSADLRAAYSSGGIGDGPLSAGVRAVLYEFDDAQAPATGTLLAESGPISVTATGTPPQGEREWKVSGWGDVTFEAAPAKAHAYLILQIGQLRTDAVVTPIAECYSASVYMRWVADPV